MKNYYYLLVCGVLAIVMMSSCRSVDVVVSSYDYDYPAYRIVPVPAYTYRLAPPPHRIYRYSPPPHYRRPTPPPPRRPIDNRRGRENSHKKGSR
ncbi:MAG: hypothetical protein IJ689_03650 [Alphaproteobacteria bacterium]|nr:hypothetical protein [Alphaproteobacteria bacterium]